MKTIHYPFDSQSEWDNNFTTQVENGSGGNFTADVSGGRLKYREHDLDDRRSFYFSSDLSGRATYIEIDHYAELDADPSEFHPAWYLSTTGGNHDLKIEYAHVDNDYWIYVDGNNTNIKRIVGTRHKIKITIDNANSEIVFDFDGSTYTLTSESRDFYNFVFHPSNSAWWNYDMVYDVYDYYLEIDYTNTAPDTPSNPVPTDGETLVPTDTVLSVEVNDPDGDNLDTSFYWDDGTLIDSDDNSPNGDVKELPREVINDKNIGVTSWNDLSDVKQADGDSAWLQLDSGTISHILKVTDFGFSIPTAATLEGIKVGVKYDNVLFADSDPATENIVSLYKDGGRGGENKASYTFSYGEGIYREYGGYGDFWNETWSPSDINKSGFGVGVTLQAGGFSEIYIDYIDITIYFSGAAMTQRLNLEDNTTHSWYTEVNDGNAVVSSPVWSFTTNAYPNKPSNPSPRNGEGRVTIT